MLRVRVPEAADRVAKLCIVIGQCGHIQLNWTTSRNDPWYPVHKLEYSCRSCQGLPSDDWYREIWWEAD